MTHVDELDTPALIIDLDVMEQNLRRVTEYAKAHHLRLRPHTKTHKIPELGRRQLAAGAVGLTVAKVSEAEVMLRADPVNLLLAYPVVGTAKLARLVEVAKRTRVTVALDSETAARGLSATGAKVGVLAELNVGLDRVGVQSGEELIQLVCTIASLPGLDFEGITFYPGHIKQASSPEMQKLSEIVAAAVISVERAGFEVQIVSGGSTPALFQSHLVERLNEIRPGTYIFNDRNTLLAGACTLRDCAASILCTVVSTAVKGQVILDGGSKTFSSDRSSGSGFGYIMEAPEAEFAKMNEEHGYVALGDSSRRWTIGEKVRVIPNHVCVAVNLHERVYGIRGNEVEEIWEVAGRGKLQ